MLRGDAPHGAGDLIERRIPRYFLPSRVGLAFWPRSAQRSLQPVLVIDEFGGRSALGANGRAGGVGRIGVQACESAIGHRRDGPATRDAEAAVPLHLPYVRVLCRHARTPSRPCEMPVAAYG